MALFLDSANVDEAQYAQELGFFEGITTTPISISQNGQKALDALTNLVEIFDGHVFYQVTAATLEKRIDEAWQAYEVRPDRVVITIPMSAENLLMVPKLSGVDIAITNIFSLSQAYIAVTANALYAIPEFNRIKKLLGDAIPLIRDIDRLLANTETEILVGDVETAEDAASVMNVGVKNLTLPMNLIKTMANQPGS